MIKNLQNFLFKPSSNVTIRVFTFFFGFINLLCISLFIPTLPDFFLTDGIVSFSSTVNFQSGGFFSVPISNITTAYILLFLGYLSSFGLIFNKYTRTAAATLFV